MSINADNIIGTYDIYSKQYILTFTEKPTLINSTDCSFDISIVPEFECAYSGLSIPDGATGDTVTATTTEGIVGTITPSTYQSGLTTYSVQVTAPNGYTNAGTILLCSTTATGTAPLSATITGPTTGTINSNITLVAEDNNFTGSTWLWTGGAAAGLTTKTISITETSTGSQTYGATIDGTYSDTHTVTWGSPSPSPFIQINGVTNGVTNSNITLTAEDYNFTGTTWVWTGGAAAGLTSKTITITETSAGSVTYGATVDGTYTDTHTVSWAASLPSFTCSDLNFAISDGTTGATINLNSDITVDEGTVTAVTPSTYQSGSSTYYPTVTIPAGYAGAGTSVTFDGTSGNPDCGDTATGSLPTYTCSDAGYTQADGLAGASTSSGASFTDSNITTYTISPTTYTSGSATYTATITVPAGYSNTGSTINCTDTALGEAGSISPDPISSFTQSQSSSTTIQVTSNKAWNLGFPGAYGSYFSASPSSGSAGTNINVTLTYTVGDGGWGGDAAIRLISTTPNILDTVTIEWSF